MTGDMDMETVQTGAGAVMKLVGPDAGPDPDPETGREAHNAAAEGRRA
jgi:hypothetical protein